MSRIICLIGTYFSILCPINQSRLQLVKLSTKGIVAVIADGVYEYVSDKLILESIIENDLNQACEKLSKIDGLRAIVWR